MAVTFESRNGSNTYYACKGCLIYPGYNHYLTRNPDSWLGVKFVLKYSQG